MIIQNKEIFIKGVSELGITLSKKQVDDFELFEQELFEWNKVMNLTSIKEPTEVVTKHFLDSLSILKYVEIPQNRTLIDVGTGAGFPGVPLKIVRNDLNTTLLDSTQKKLKFIENVLSKLEYTNCNIIHSRAEDAGNNTDLREKFDFVTARAVAELRVLTEYSLPLVKVGGSFIAMKGSDSSIEIGYAQKAIKLLGGEIENTFKFTIPNTEINRTIIVIRKIEHTSSNYPRMVNKMKRQPL